MKGTAIVSGGMDSITMLHAYKNDISHVLHFNYGSKHNEMERRFAAYHAELLDKSFYTITLPFISKSFKSALLQDQESIPEGHYADETMRKTVVPFRNGIMLSIAAGYAESNNCDSLFIANHFGDHAIYPDCRESFIGALRNAIQLGTYAQISLMSPFCSWTKRQIAETGKDLGIDYSFTYSCYKGGEKHCGRCGTCVERKEALMGFDPTDYLDKDFMPKQGEYKDGNKETDNGKEASSEAQGEASETSQSVES